MILIIAFEVERVNGTREPAVDGVTDSAVANLTRPSWRAGAYRPFIAPSVSLRAGVRPCYNEDTSYARRGMSERELIRLTSMVACAG